ASPPARTFSMSAICVASPESNRCWSRTHTSLRTVTMASCSAGTASGSVNPSCVVSGSRSNSSTSSSVKPTRSRLNASSCSDWSSTRSISSSHPALMARRLEERDRAREALTELFNEAKGANTHIIVERIVTDIDDIVKKVRFPEWQQTTQGERLVQKELRRTLLKYKLHSDQ